ncbi:DEKNAAC103571 [Brettanomyces naardenensis]|uniref:DEKNAAC103571 n=1 Tax=Brettanomyces naardenensis TaxID=13370 RepID=A0A448YN84_BRENA|nr:DEKNAAC103571 [Brettanomyces naardenensis]
MLNITRRASPANSSSSSSAPPYLPPKPIIARPLSDSYGRPRNFSSTSSGSESKQTVGTSLRNIIRNSTVPIAMRSSDSGSFTVSSNSVTNDASGTPEELLPIVTLIHAQQARCYFEASVQVPISDVESSTNSLESIHWHAALIKLIGTDLAIYSQQGKNLPAEADRPLVINISDSEVGFIQSKPFFDLKIQITNDKCYYIRSETQEDVDYLLAGLLLSQFEFKQLQESFTGALLSSKAIAFSDVRTLLDPKNQYTHEEWCILRFPFINDKWIRCYVVVIPPSRLEKRKTKATTGKIEIYISSSKSKKNLLASAINGRSVLSVYPESPEYIDNNALVRLWADYYINHALLEKIISEDATDSDVIMAHSRSLTKKISNSSLASLRQLQAGGGAGGKHSRRSSWAKPRPASISSFRQQHRRADSGMSLASSHSEAGYAKRPDKMKDLDILQTKLCYIIPETHGSILPCETMIRLLIPVMNIFHLYGRPEKFAANREEKNSLLFGFPQLPHTQYLDMQNAYDLVSLNVGNSSQQHWSSYEWVEVFKEMLHVKMSKGWNGTGSLVDNFKDGLLYEKQQGTSSDDLDYDPAEDFGSNSTSEIHSSIAADSPPIMGSSKDFSKTNSSSLTGMSEIEDENQIQHSDAKKAAAFAFKHNTPPPLRASVDTVLS